MLIEIPNVGCFESEDIIGIANDCSRTPIRRIKHVVEEHEDDDEEYDVEYTDYINKYSVTITYSNGNHITLYSTCPCLYKRVKSYIKNAEILSKPSKIVTLSTNDQIQVDYIKDISIDESEESVSDGWFKSHLEKRYCLNIQYLDPKYDTSITYKSKEDLDKDLALLKK